MTYAGPVSTPPSTPPEWRRRLDALGAASRSVARDTARNTARAVRERPTPAEPEKPRFEPTSWHGALTVMAGVAAVLWVVQIVNAALHYRLSHDLALHPRAVSGLWGIVFAPVVHDSYFHLLSNTLPFVLVGWAVLLAGVRGLVISTAMVVLIGGALTWLDAPSGTVLGCGLVILGWMGYLIARAFFSRSFKWILVAVLVLFFFGTLLGALVPSFGHGVAWEASLSYFVAGLAAGAVLHGRERRQRQSRPRWYRPGGGARGAGGA